MESTGPVQLLDHQRRITYNAWSSFEWTLLLLVHLLENFGVSPDHQLDQLIGIRQSLKDLAAKLP